MTRFDEPTRELLSPGPAWLKPPAVGLAPDDKRLHDEPLRNTEPKLRALFDKLAQRGTLLVVVDQPATIGALPVAVVRAAAGHQIACLPGLAMRRIASEHTVSGRGIHRRLGCCWRRWRPSQLTESFGRRSADRPCRRATKHRRRGGPAGTARRRAASSSAPWTDQVRYAGGSTLLRRILPVGPLGRLGASQIRRGYL